MKFLTKPWIIQGLQNFLKNKNDICSKFLKCKSQHFNKYFHCNYETYRNLSFTLLKREKEKYFTFSIKTLAILKKLEKVLTL